MINLASSKILSSIPREGNYNISSGRSFNYQTLHFSYYLCLLIFFVTGCSTSPKMENSALLLKKSSSQKEQQLFLGKTILKSAQSQLGKRYKFGGTTPKKGFDCSGLAWFSHKQNGILIPRKSSDQFKGGIRVSKKNLSPGDLVFFETYRKGASHVGIYKGDGNFIHSLNRNKKVAIQKLSNNYYKRRYLGARRYW